MSPTRRIVGFMSLILGVVGFAYVAYLELDGYGWGLQVLAMTLIAFGSYVLKIKPKDIERKPPKIH